MKKTAFLFLCASTLFAATAAAQDETDAIRFSRTYHGGTARFSAMGGAFTALGGDASTLAFNPAGVGVYSSGEFTFTPALTYSNTTSSFMGNKAADDRYLLGLPNIAAIGVINFNDSQGLISLNLGISSSRHNTFSGRTMVQGSGVDKNNSYMNYFASLANSGGVSDYVEYEQDLAWGAYLLNEDTTNHIFHPALADGDYTKSRRGTETWGSIREFDFSLGGNISHIFYFGVTVGIQNVSYSKDLIDVDESLSELPADVSPYEGFTYNKTYRMDGTGYNFKFGVIARPFAYADFLSGLRIGAAIHTPTFISMSDDYSAEMEASFLTPNDKGDHVSSAYLDGGSFGYELQTPFKFMLGGSYTFGSQGSQWRGILSMDYELSDYSKMKMRNNSNSDGYLFRDENSNILTYFKSTHNLRFGGELGYDRFAFRGGYAYYASPYTSSVGKDGNTHIASFGLGYRGRSAFIDFAYSRLMQKDNEYLYNSEGRGNVVVKSAPISYDIVQANFMVTVGWRF